jgi:hypothetical protein
MAIDRVLVRSLFGTWLLEVILSRQIPALLMSMSSFPWEFSMYPQASA